MLLSWIRPEQCIRYYSYVNGIIKNYRCNSACYLLRYEGGSLKILEQSGSDAKKVGAVTLVPFLVTEETLTRVQSFQYLKIHPMMVVMVSVMNLEKSFRLVPTRQMQTTVICW